MANGVEPDQFDAIDLLRHASVRARCWRSRWQCALSQPQGMLLLVDALTLFWEQVINPHHAMDRGSTGGTQVCGGAHSGALHIRWFNVRG